jgi:hypothetical protein
VLGLNHPEIMSLISSHSSSNFPEGLDGDTISPVKDPLHVEDIVPANWEGPYEFAAAEEDVPRALESHVNADRSSFRPHTRFVNYLRYFVDTLDSQIPFLSHLMPDTHPLAVIDTGKSGVAYCYLLVPKDVVSDGGFYVVVYFYRGWLPRLVKRFDPVLALVDLLGGMFESSLDSAPPCYFQASYDGFSYRFKRVRGVPRYASTCWSIRAPVRDQA